MSLQTVERQVFIIQGQVSVLQNQIAGIQTDIAGLPALTTQVATNTTNISTLQGDVSTLQGDVAGLPALTTQVATNTGNIASNTSGLATTKQQVSAINTKLQAVPTSVGQQTTNLNYTKLPHPSKYIPDESPPIANIVGLSGWRFTKPTGTNSTKINWYMFNPYYAVTPPLVAPIPAIPRSSLKSVWAVITTTNPITTQGYIFFNIYTYDYLNPPTLPLSSSGAPPFFSNKWSYQACPNAIPTSTAIPSLCAGYKYLLYCWDAPKLVTTPASSITIAMANGQFPSQTTSQMLRDPLDIYTDLVHVPFGAVSFHTTNTPQPADPLSINVSGISIETGTGNVNPALDFTVEAFGYNDQRFVLTY